MVYNFQQGVMAGASGAGDVYVPAGAIWLDGSADYLTWTPGSAGNRKTWTTSVWVKLSKTGVSHVVFGAGTSGVSFAPMITTSTTYASIDGAGVTALATSAIHRDAAAWMNIVIAVDTTNATANDRVRMWINGVEQTDFGTRNNPALDTQGHFNNTVKHNIGIDPYDNSSSPFNGYMSEFIMLDGTASTDASEFGEYDAKGNWVPKDPTGLTFGTNGFWLNFADSSNPGKRAEREAAHGNTTLLIHSNTTDGSTTFVDSALGATITANGSIQHDDAQAKFGTTSIYSASSSDYLTVPDSSNLTFGSNDFTIAFWYRNNGSYGSNAGWLDKLQGAGAREWTFGIMGGNIYFQFSNDGTANWHNMFIYAHSLSADTWHHIAVTRNGSNWYLFIDGTLVDTDTDSASIYNSTAVVRLCSDDLGGYNGWVDELLIVNGTAIWTASFDVPTAAYDGLDFKTISMSAANSVSDRPADKAEDDLGNYATWNVLDKDDGITSVYNGNLSVVTNGSNGSIRSTIGFPSGKWYWEVTSDSINGAGTQAVGIMPQSQLPTNNMSDIGKLGYALDVSSQDRKFENGTATAYGTYTQANGAVYMLAFDQDAGKLWYGINGTWLASGDPAAGSNPSSSSISTSTVYVAAVSDNTVSGTFTANFGQSGFTYTPPTGFKALNTANLPAPTVTDPSDGIVDCNATGANIEATLAALRSGWASYIEIFLDITAAGSTQMRFSDDSSNMHDLTTANGKAAFSAPTGSNTFYGLAVRVGATYGVYTAQVSHTNGSDTNTAHGLTSDTGRFAAIMMRDDAGDEKWVTHPSLTTNYNVRLDYSTNNMAQTATQHVAVDATNVTIKSGETTGTYRVIVFAEIPGYLEFSGWVANYLAPPNGNCITLGVSPLVSILHPITHVSYRWKLYSDGLGGNAYNVRDDFIKLTESSALISNHADKIDMLSNGMKIQTVQGNELNNSGESYIGIHWGRPFGGSGVAQAKAR